MERVTEGAVKKHWEWVNEDVNNGEPRGRYDQTPRFARKPTIGELERDLLRRDWLC